MGSTPIGRTEKAWSVVRQELAPAQPWLWLSTSFVRLIPSIMGSRARTACLRRFGWRIGVGTLLFDVPRLNGSGPILQRLEIGAHTNVNVGCQIELSDGVQIGDHVAIGHDVLILTSTHRLGRSDRRAGLLYAAPVRIEDGAWIGARATILPGVTIGAGAVVSAGAVVNKDVGPNVIVAGAPATVIVKRLPG